MDAELELAKSLDFDLVVGPHTQRVQALGPDAEEVLRRAWSLRSDELSHRKIGTRPWAWWFFGQGREAPRLGPDETRALAAIPPAEGGLTDAEAATLLELGDEKLAKVGPGPHVGVHRRIASALALQPGRYRVVTAKNKTCFITKTTN